MDSKALQDFKEEFNKFISKGEFQQIPVLYSARQTRVIIPPAGYVYEEYNKSGKYVLVRGSSVMKIEADKNVQMYYHWREERDRCMHDWVNVGFNTIKMACKHCNVDKPKERIKGEVKIGKTYYRSDNDKEVTIVAERQGSGWNVDTCFMLGSDGKNYTKDGQVIRYDDDDDVERDRVPNDWFLHEGDKA